MWCASCLLGLTGPDGGWLVFFPARAAKRSGINWEAGVGEGWIRELQSGPQGVVSGEGHRFSAWHGGSLGVMFSECPEGESNAVWCCE